MEVTAAPNLRERSTTGDLRGTEAWGDALHLPRHEVLPRLRLAITSTTPLRNL